MWGGQHIMSLRLKSERDTSPVSPT